MTHGLFGWSYPPGCNGLPSDEDQPVDITKELEAFAKPGHGLCGKDADLDYGGQIAIVAAFLNEETIEARLRVYATICPPEGDEQADIAGEIVGTWADHPSGVSGEWTGDDWCWSLSNVEGGQYLVSIPIPFVSDGDYEADKKRAAQAIHDAIWEDEGIKAFRASMTGLAKVLDGIEGSNDAES